MTLYPEFAGEHALVTGVASGIGEAQAQTLLAAKAHVWGLDCQKNDHVTSLQTDYPNTFHFIQADVSQSAQLRQLEPILANQFVRYLFNTAGILDAYRPTLELTETEWDHFLAVNLKSHFLLTNLVLPQMLANKSGVIVNMASIAGLVAGGGGAAYTAAKHAIIGYTKQVDYDYAKQGIRVNCLAPGAIKTPMNAADFAGDGQMAKWVAKHTPAQRWADPQEVADLSMFIASNQAGYIHGAVIPIDGGWIEQ